MTAPNQTERTHFNRATDRLRDETNRVRRVLTKDIWELNYLGRKTLQGRFYLLLRVLMLTWQGLRRNHIPVQAAAMTFYSLIGLGPLIALGIMISGFLVEQGDGESVVKEKISEAIAFAAPQVTIGVEGTGGIGEDGKTGKDGDGVGLAPEMSELIDGFVSSARSGTVGVVGSLMLFVIGLQVLSSIEKSFNTLWGVDRGRRLGERIVFYWTFISLGAVLGSAALTLVTLRTISGFMEKLPFGGEFLAVFLFFSPILSFLLLVFLLAAFFRFIPNTKVEWKPAFTGAAIVVLLLHLYNMLSFLYVQRVVDTRSLYGSVGILIILMLGLFIFWLLILLGGQITYAVQNANYLTNENAWQKTSTRTREVVSLAALLLIHRRFHELAPPIQNSELLEKLRVPSHILNSSINRLSELGFIYAVENTGAGDESDRAYQAGQPSESITLGSFKQAFDCHGNCEGLELITECVPAVRTYLDEVVSFKDSPEAEKTLADLIASGHPHSRNQLTDSAYGSGPE